MNIQAQNQHCKVLSLMLHLFLLRLLFKKQATKQTHTKAGQ